MITECLRGATIAKSKMIPLRVEPYESGVIVVHVTTSARTCNKACTAFCRGVVVIHYLSLSYALCRGYLKVSSSPPCYFILLFLLFMRPALHASTNVSVHLSPSLKPLLRIRATAVQRRTIARQSVFLPNDCCGRNRSEASHTCLWCPIWLFIIRE